MFYIDKNVNYFWNLKDRNVLVCMDFPMQQTLQDVRELNKIPSLQCTYNQHVPKP